MKIVSIIGDLFQRAQILKLMYLMIENYLHIAQIIQIYCLVNSVEYNRIMNKC